MVLEILPRTVEKLLIFLPIWHKYRTFLVLFIRICCFSSHSFFLFHLISFPISKPFDYFPLLCQGENMEQYTSLLIKLSLNFREFQTAVLLPNCSIDAFYHSSCPPTRFKQSSRAPHQCKMLKNSLCALRTLR